MSATGNSDQSLRRSTIRRVLRLAALGMGTTLLIVLALSLWNFAVARWQYAHNPVPGSFYTVEGRQMHLDCSGTGSPTVILEAAASAPWSEWRQVQPGLSQQTQVCSYDRAGHGWSQPRTGWTSTATSPVAKSEISRLPPVCRSALRYPTTRI